MVKILRTSVLQSAKLRNSLVVKGLIWCLYTNLLLSPLFFHSYAVNAVEQLTDVHSGLLFRVEKPGNEPSYLFGTIHSEDPRVIALPASVRNAFTNARLLVMELVLDAPTLLQSMTALLLDDGRDLESIIGADLYRETREAVTAHGYPAITIQRFKPWAVVTLLSVPPAKTGRFLDLVLYERALAEGKSVHGLESVQEQFKPFDALSEDEQIAMLRATLEVRNQLSAMYRELLDAYLSRDLLKLVDLNEINLAAGDASLAERLKKGVIDDRNYRMVERMIPLLQEGRAFVAVGALHLPGKEGVLSLLRRSDYKVTRVY